jgi:hypothetical protein
MKCIICGKEVKINNSIVCCDKCGTIYNKIIEIQNKYFPCHGCENCLGDLHQGCTEECKTEFDNYRIFGTDLWNLIHLIFN